jgi:hypothetical protein
LVGRVDQIQQVARPSEPPEALLYFGLAGGLLHRSAERLRPTNLYIVKMASDELVMAQDDAEFALGECVEVIPVKRQDPPTNTFGYGYAPIVASRKCGGRP